MMAAFADGSVLVLRALMPLARPLSARGMCCSYAVSPTARADDPLGCSRPRDHVLVTEMAPLLRDPYLWEAIETG